MKRFGIWRETLGLGRLCVYLVNKVWRFTLILGALALISSTPSVASAQVIISEFMASNKTVLLDEDGEAEDWIELHNTGSSAVQLQGWYLTDDSNDLQAWTFPDVSLQANEYLLVFASNKDRAASNSELHTNFKLKSGGEFLALVRPDGTSVASEYAPEYPNQFDDISYGGSTYFPRPTPGSANSAGVSELEGSLAFGLPHGFYQSPQTLTLTSNLPNGTTRYTLDGSTPPSDTGCDAAANGQPWSFHYYEGTWTSLPDLDTLTPVESGTSDQVSTDVRRRDQNFALRFIGCVNAPTDGLYTFSTTSDDGSQLLVDGQPVIDNQSTGSAATISNEVALNKGLHEVVIDYFQASGDHQLAAQWVAPMRGETYAATPDEGNDYAANAASTDFIEFEFDLPADGEFQFSALVQGTSLTSDSFWVQLNDGPLWLYRIPVSSTFQEVNLNDDNTAIRSTLSKGEHKLKFFPREDGARIDSVKVSAIVCDGPCQTQIKEAEIEDISGQFVLAGLDAEAIPAQGWFTYSSPIQISETTTVRAVAIQKNFRPSDVETQSYFFVDDVVMQSRNEASPPGWPEGNINGQDMDYGMDPEIVDPDPQALKASLLSLPSISIVTDIDNMLHPSIGIYVNASQKGRYWERPASIELIDPQNSEAGFTIDAGVRIRGGFSRTNGNPKHPFRLYFRGSYDGDLEYPLFGEEGVDNFERMDLRSPNNYNWAFRGDNRNTFLRELWSRDTQAALGQPYTRSRYYHLYLNGQYWGVTMTQERISKEYAESYFGGDEDDYDVVKHNRDANKQYEASDGFNQAWNQIWETVADQTISSTEYTLLEQQVDLDNLIDYMLGNAYEGDLDGATSWFSNWRRANNWYGVRDRKNGNLKWSFFQHDGEHTLGARPSSAEGEIAIGPHAPFNGEANQYFLKNYMNPYWLHAALATNLEYQQRFIDRVAEVFAEDGVLSNKQGLARWLTRKAQVQPAILAHSARWGDAKKRDPLTINDWQSEVDLVENTFFADRAEVVFNQLLNIGLASDILLPSLSIESGTTVEEGTFLDITPVEGAIYYTLDGSDPRAIGGTPSKSARQLANEERIEITSDIKLRIRVFKDGRWSTLSTADYFVLVEEEEESCFVIKTKQDSVVTLCF